MPTSSNTSSRSHKSFGHSSFVTFGSAVSMFAVEAHGFVQASQHGQTFVDTSIAEEMGDAASVAEMPNLRPRGDFMVCVFKVLARHTYTQHVKMEVAFKNGRAGDSEKDSVERERRSNAAEQQSALGRRVCYGTRAPHRTQGVAFRRAQVLLCAVGQAT
jgi:hypothetical protein